MGDVNAKTGLLIVGSTFIGLALLSLGILSTMYWPFQSVVQVVAPFLGVSILASVGLSLVLTALLASRLGSSRATSLETNSVIDSLLSEANRRR